MVFLWLNFQWWYPSWLPVPPLSEADLYLHPVAGKESCPAVTLWGLSFFGNFKPVTWPMWFFSSQSIAPKRWSKLITSLAFHGRSWKSEGSCDHCLADAPCDCQVGMLYQVGSHATARCFMMLSLFGRWIHHERFNVFAGNKLPRNWWG